MRILLAAVFGLGLTVGAFAQTSAKQDMKDAGHETADAAKDAGHGVAEGAKKTGHAVKHGTKRGVHKAASGLEKGADKVKDKTR